MIFGRLKSGLNYHVVRGRRLDDPKYWNMQFSDTGNDAIVAYEFLIDEITTSSGCAYEYEDEKTLLFMISDYIKKRDLEYAKRVLNDIIECGGFDKDCFEKGILTNKELQEDFVYATQRRKQRKIENCCLLTAEEINDLSDGHVHELDFFSDINGVIVNISPYIVNKEEQSKS